MHKEGIEVVTVDAHRAALQAMTKDELVWMVLALTEFGRDMKAKLHALQEEAKRDSR